MDWPQKAPPLTPDLLDYLIRHGSPPDPVLTDLVAETRALGGPAGMQVAVEQGPLLTLLAALCGGRYVVEVGTFTGYSSICLARGLAPGGRLVCCDVSEEWTAVARRYWERAGLADWIELRLGPAADTLAALPEEPVIDLAFLDADKPGYLRYAELLAPRLRVGGLLVADNVLASGRVVDPTIDDEFTRAVRSFNDALAADPRWEVVMLPVGDGTTLARRSGVDASRGGDS
ncbi:MAG: O-methyltransferase [Mycobacteriales bacterium]